MPAAGKDAPAGLSLLILLLLTLGCAAVEPPVEPTPTFQPAPRGIPLAPAGVLKMAEVTL